MSSRRSPLELYRDGLLVLAINGKPMKRTPFMYGLGVSWHALLSFEHDARAKKLIRRVDHEEMYERLKEPLDRRTKYWLEITMKGQYVLRWLDELLKYIADDSGPGISPPLWILRTLFRGRFEDMKFEDTLKLDQPYTVEMAQLEFTLRSPKTLLDGEASLPARFIILNPSQYSVVDRGPIVVSWSEELKAVFFIRGKRLRRWHCPECGASVKNELGLKIHVGRKHPEKKREILDLVQRFLIRQ